MRLIGEEEGRQWRSQLMEALQALAHEKKIDEFYLIERLEASLAKSYQNILDLEWDARVTIDRTTGKIYVYELVPVGEPDEETGEYAEFEERDVYSRRREPHRRSECKGRYRAMVREAAVRAFTKSSATAWATS